MKNIIPVIIVIGLVIALIVFGYTAGYKIGSTIGQDITQQAIALNGMWQKQCDQARATYLNQNDMNNIIEVAHSWDRAAYNKSYKPIR